ncbi:Cytochrome c oxidase assembly protein CtaG/Cox11 [Dillenia turbinata]|uniref:Cytochrome c oxidase assembly protein CtaG/Cox11 n=1 Tax=Dillenia turbinata TaxID=194707 RepID=A0AAN8WB44_9MAGN
MSEEVMSMLDSWHDYVSVDDKQDCSSVSNLVMDNFQSKCMAFSHDHSEDGGFVKPMGRNREFAVGDISCEERMRFAKMQDRKSLESTIKESNSRAIQGCCEQTANEKLKLIRIGDDLLPQMQVFFYIDPEFETDPKMDGINNIILSYTFFKISEE